MAGYLAVDIGASSGRHMYAETKDGKLRLTEVYRFENFMDETKDGLLYWDAERLFREVKAGMRACAEKGFKPDYMGIDTWGDDFMLLDKSGKPLTPCVAYRDSRTAGMDKKLDEIIPESEYFERTGSARHIFNTVYHLMAIKQSQPEALESAETLLLLPSYLMYLLTGKGVNEYSEATTTGLIDAKARDWDRDMIEKIGLPARLFKEKPTMPGTPLGRVKDEIAAETGLSCEVVIAPTHDTGAAFLAAPMADDETIVLNSGTWSLLGVESAEPILGKASLESGFSNEGAYGGRIRYLKNIMGMWIIQCIRREDGKRFSYAEMAEMVVPYLSFPSRIDAVSERFLAPKSMTEEIKNAVIESGQTEVTCFGELLAVCYNSLADAYKNSVTELEKLTGKRFTKINIMGGGSQNETLNRLTAEVTGLPVYAGPAECTALGNIASQMLACGEAGSVAHAREIIRDSFSLKEYKA